MLDKIKEILKGLEGLSIEEKVETINSIKAELHKHSPHSAEPVDCVLWVRADCLEANDYNPNKVATPEMELLRRSVAKDGYTQPIVSWQKEENYEVVDGFHRNRVGRECKEIAERTHGYLPITVINDHREDRGDRIAATIRHNRARGKHLVDSMSEIVLELKRRNWTEKKIAKELGMDQDEVLRLAQITGLAEMFANEEFSKAWEAEAWAEEEFEVIDD